MELSLIIPAYNEAQRIGPSLETVVDYMSARAETWEVIVVDDGSRDETTRIVERFADRGVRLIRMSSNLGKGAAVRRGMLEATGRYRIFTDADLSTPVEEIDNALLHLRSYDIAIGSRAVDRSYVQVHQPWYRETMGKIFNLIVQALAIPGIKDTQCGFKAFRADAAERVFRRSVIDGFSFDVEALFIARKLGLSIIEFPVRWFNDERTTVNPLIEPLNMIRGLWRIRMTHRKWESEKEKEKERGSTPAS